MLENLYFISTYTYATIWFFMNRDLVKHAMCRKSFFFLKLRYVTLQYTYSLLIKYLVIQYIYIFFHECILFMYTYVFVCSKQLYNTTWLLYNSNVDKFIDESMKSRVVVGLYEVTRCFWWVSLLRVFSLYIYFCFKMDYCIIIAKILLPFYQTTLQQFTYIEQLYCVDYKLIFRQIQLKSIIYQLKQQLLKYILDLLLVVSIYCLLIQQALLEFLVRLFW
eukprot:TRINITY_DN10675_c0_g1_i2.p3 TRINITY_DN10675_c0_g1~~TRINITY_DN10675_c0_g1_i2.p3  ORF type:complete len:220 (+),score=-26.19 TRINITY_DN10675_c0_g1_i2:358-1017(+)